MQTFRLLAPSAAIVAALLTGASAVAAPATDPQSFLRGAVDEVLAVVYAPGPGSQPLSVRVRPLLEKHFTAEGITRRAVGPGWRQFTPAQQKRTVELFFDLVLRTYADRFTPTEKPRITFGATTEIAANRREVQTSLTYQGSTYSVAYRVEQTGDTWKIYDIVIEGVSMVANYRAQLDALFQKGGAAEVIRTLEQKLTELDNAKSA